MLMRLAEMLAMASKPIGDSPIEDLDRPPMNESVSGLDPEEPGGPGDARAWNAVGAIPNR